MSETVISRHRDVDALVAAAAAEFISTVTAAQRERGEAIVVLTGGGAGIGLLRSLAADSGDVDWSKVTVFFGDERFVAEGDPERNEGQARDALLDHVPVDPARVFTVAALGGEFGDDLDAAARAYEELVTTHAPDGFDLHLLGMGGEGHINSLFPHTPAVAETERLVVAVHDSPKPPPARVSLTLPAVARARQVWLLVSGAEKADATAAAIGGTTPAEVPSAGAHGIDRTVWFLDQAASARLA